jgi:hypothetical protein
MLTGSRGRILKVIDRRSFFSRIFGGAAAIVVAPHIKTKPRWNISTLKPLKRTFHAYNQTPCVDMPLLTDCIIETEMGELEVSPNLEPIPDIELCPEFLETENSTQDGLGVTSHDLPAGCPIGYY